MRGLHEIEGMEPAGTMIGLAQTRDNPMSDRRPWPATKSMFAGSVPPFHDVSLLLPPTLRSGEAYHKDCSPRILAAKEMPYSDKTKSAT